jgi:response regulator RpfG family c-di-GMP phosphodiesterase
MPFRSTSLTCIPPPEFFLEEALAYIKKQSGKHFDPNIVELFFKVVN